MEPKETLNTKLDLEIEIPQDLYRDTPVRYLGYANEVGEAFRKIIGSKMVLATYGVATAYVLADTVDKSTKMYNDSQDYEKRDLNTAYVAGDTLLWQMLASVVIPGFTINRVCAGSYYLLKDKLHVAKNPRKIAVAAIGLAVIPFIIHPIDRMVDALLECSIRKIRPF